MSRFAALSIGIHLNLQYVHLLASIWLDISPQPTSPINHGHFLLKMIYMLIRVLEYLYILKRVIGCFLGYKLYIIPVYKGTELVIVISLAQVLQGQVSVTSRNSQTLLVKICQWFLSRAA